jgi:predicted nucleic-acid-binding protein
MAAPHVDTNLFIRFLTGDDLQQQAAAAAIFEQIEKGVLTVMAPDTVIADAVFVLASPRLYNLSHSMVQTLLIPLVSLPHFQVDNREMLVRALAIFGSTTRFDFSDCCILARMEQAGSTEIYSFDKDFDRFPGVTRIES